MVDVRGEKLRGDNVRRKMWKGGGGGGESGRR